MSANLRVWSSKYRNIITKSLKVDHCDGWTLKLQLCPFSRKLIKHQPFTWHPFHQLGVGSLHGLCAVNQANELSLNTRQVALLATLITYRILLEALSTVKAFFCICFSSGSIICFPSSKVATGLHTASLAPDTMSLWTSKTRASRNAHIARAA